MHVYRIVQTDNGKFLTDFTRAYDALVTAGYGGTYISKKHSTSMWRAGLLGVMGSGRVAVPDYETRDNRLGILETLEVHACISGQNSGTKKARQKNRTVFSFWRLPMMAQAFYILGFAFFIMAILFAQRWVKRKLRRRRRRRVKSLGMGSGTMAAGSNVHMGQGYDQYSGSGGGGGLVSATSALEINPGSSVMRRGARRDDGEQGATRPTMI